MARHFGRKRPNHKLGFVAVEVPLDPPVGFTLNGSTNTTMKAALAAVQANSSRMMAVVKGDSTSAGFGAAITADGTSSSIVAQTAGARPYVPYKVMADLMTADGYDALNNSVVADNGIKINDAGSLPDFDPRVTFGSGTDVFTLTNQSFAGGGFVIQNAAPSTFSPTESVDTFVVYILNTTGAIGFTIDGSPASGITAPGAAVAGNVVTSPGSNNGFTRIVIPAGSLGLHTLGIFASVSTPTWGALGAYDSSVCAVDIYNHAVAGAFAAHQAASEPTNHWFNNDFLAFQAPHLTIINVGLNDSSGGSDTTSYRASLQTLITTAKLSGDVLVLWANAADPGPGHFIYQDAFHDAAADVAETNNVAFGDIRAAFGSWPATIARTADGIVHPNRGYYADIAAYVWSCVKYMREN